MTVERTDHAHFRLLAAAGIDGELTSSELLELRGHLAGCEPCRLDEQAMRRDNAWLMSAQAGRPPKPAVRAAVLMAARNPGRRVSRDDWLIRFAGAVALLVVAIGASWLGFGRLPNTPGVLPSGSVSLPTATPGLPSIATSTCAGTPFSEPIRTSTTSAGSVPWDLAHADFDEDGIEDIAIVSRDPGSVGIMLGDGRGGFSQPRPFTPAGPNPLAGAMVPAIRASDFTGDGHQDVIVTNETTGVVIFTGDGAGSLESSWTVEVGGQPRDTAPGRLAGGPALDLAVADATGGVRIVVDAANGGSEELPPIAITGSPLELEVSDLDGDGRDDIAVANDGDRGLVVVMQVDVGEFGAPLMLGAPPATDVDLADLDGDGRLDAIMANAGRAAVSILLGDGAGSFGSAAVHPFEGGAPGSTVTLDLDDDGDLDIVANSVVSEDLGVLIGDGSGRFALLGRIPAPGRPTGLISGDLNGDGRVDVATSNADSDDVAVFLNICQGSAP